MAKIADNLKPADPSAGSGTESGLDWGHGSANDLTRPAYVTGRKGIQALAVPPSDSANRKNMSLLVQLRWIAVAGQIVTILVVERWLGIALPLEQMAIVLSALVGLNLGTHIWLRGREEVSNRALLLVLVFDVAALTVQLWLSGGAINPFTSLFLLQVTLGAVLLEGLSTWVIVVLASMSVVGLTFSYRPLVMPHDEMGGMEMTGMFSLHIEGMLACFILDAVLLVIFVTRVSRNLRERDAHLASLRQRAAEESHIVRMGLLATGAAHELGTPLASLAVILGDWRRMPAIRADNDMAQELEEMEAAVQRCKTIVTGILLSAGETRGEESEATTLNRFFDEIVREWRELRSTDTLMFENRIPDQSITVAFDTIVKQAIFNVLENAFDASPERIYLTVEQEGESLLVRVKDMGPGFRQEMIQQIGKPYHTSKDRPGSGLGLFLVVNVIRKLGGTVTARNLAEGGAEVSLQLPLAALRIAGPQHV